MTANSVIIPPGNLSIPHYNLIFRPYQLNHNGSISAYFNLINHFPISYCFLKIAGYHPDNQQFLSFFNSISYHTAHPFFLQALGKYRVPISLKSDDIIKTAIFMVQKHSCFFVISGPFLSQNHNILWYLFPFSYHSTSDINVTTSTFVEWIIIMAEGHTSPLTETT